MSRFDFSRKFGVPVFHRVTLTAFVLAATTAVAMGASVAQADCVTNDDSSPCHWTAPANTPDANSPNLVQQGNGVLSVQPVNAGDVYSGYKLSGGNWDECTASPVSIGEGGDGDVCTSVSLGTTVHVLQIDELSSSNENWLGFPTGH
jgi:hypothetical protein